MLKKAMHLTVDEQINSLTDRISGIQWRYDVWDSLDDTKNGHDNVAVLNKYLHFFRPVECALFESYVIACAQLFETRKDTVNFITIKKHLEANGVNLAEIPEFEEIEKNMKKTWKKLSKIRNEYVGHLTNTKSISQVYSDASLNHEEVRIYINNAKTLINIINIQRGYPADIFNLYGSETTENLLNDLKCLL